MPGPVVKLECQQFNALALFPLLHVNIDEQKQQKGQIIYGLFYSLMSSFSHIRYTIPVPTNIYLILVLKGILKHFIENIFEGLMRWLSRQRCLLPGLTT